MMMVMMMGDDVAHLDQGSKTLPPRMVSTSLYELVQLYVCVNDGGPARSPQG
jgi:hypothetical protein